MLGDSSGAEDSSSPSDILDEDAGLERRRAEDAWQDGIIRKPRVGLDLPARA